MKPEFFQSEGNRVFGVYHPAQGHLGRASPHAVVVCPPFGQEAIRSHKCLLLLANRLAGNGVHVLRFAYRGTDDSDMWADEITSLKDWINDIVAAKHYLQRLTECNSVMLLGLRMGANLAVQVARQSHDVHSLVLWEPIQDGVRYLYRLRQNQRQMLDLWHCKVASRDTDEIEELFATPYQLSVLREIQQLQLDTADLQQPILNIAAPQAVAERGRGGTGGPQSRQDPPFYISPNGMEKRMYAPESDAWELLNDLETLWWRPQSVQRIVAEVSEMFDRVQQSGWHQAVRPETVHSYLDRASRIPVGSTATTAPHTANSFVQETVMRIPNAQGLVGILTEPDPSRGPDGAPVVLMLNAGVVHRVGPFRLHVYLARMLAQCGFASFRFDLSGLGDSPPRSGKLSRDQRVREDLQQVMDCLEAHGYNHGFAILGLCSGAYHAHQTALADRRVKGVVFLDGIAFRTVGFYVRHYVFRLLRPRFWRNFIKRRWKAAVGAERDESEQQGRALAEAEFFHVDRSRQKIASEIQQMADAFQEMLFVYTGGHDDVHGRRQFQEMFGVVPNEQIQVDYMAESEHTFRLAAHREQLCRRICDWMLTRLTTCSAKPEWKDDARERPTSLLPGKLS